MSEDARRFVEETTEKIAPMVTELEKAVWDLSVTGREEHAKRRAEIDAAITRIFANPDEFARLRAWREEIIADPLLARQVEMLYHAYLGNQKDEATIERMTALESDVEMSFYNYRPQFEGKPANDNELREVLLGEVDTARRKIAWEASKEVGAVVAEKVRELVRLRNAAARRVDFPNYYSMSIAIQELDEDDLFRLIDELERLTREPFRREKERLDAYLANRFGIAPDDIRPWHYSDFFFQEPQVTGDVDLAPFFAGKDLVALALQTYDGIGLNVRPVLERSDLYPREGKDQHAFCMSVDRGDDIRVLCNLQPDEHWMSTLLHELGHAAYDQGIDRGLPYLLREPAHTLLTEATAMIMGRLTRDAYWLRTIAGLPADQLATLHPKIAARSRLGMLIFARWCMVMVYFERDLYRDPERDLNALWWDYVERFQMLRRPEGRNAPDWAAKIHIALSPVYYHNYLLGEMVASQMHHTIVASVNPLGAVDSPQVGRFLRSKLFSHGARHRWDETIEQLTGERLDPRWFADQFVTG